MVLNPVFVFASAISTSFTEEVINTEFDNALDTDSHQEDEQNEEDSKQGKEEFKIITTIETYSFSFSKTKLLTEFYFPKSLVQETLLPPPDFS